MRDVENLTTYQTHHGVAIYNTSILWILKVDGPSIEMKIWAFLINWHNAKNVSAKQALSKQQVENFH